MKKFSLKIFTAILLMFGLLFGAPALLAPDTTPFLNSAYADPPVDDDDGLADDLDDTDEPGLGDPAETPSTPETPDEKDDDDDNNNNDSNDGEDNNDENGDGEDDNGKNSCQDQTGALSWIVCPTSGVIATAIDSLYNGIEDLLVIEPLSMEDDSPIYIVWKYMLGLTNIVFIIFLVIVIYSQLTGVGLSNYGIKRVLPRLIIAIVLVNLSFIICTVGVDASNIVGSSLREFLGGIQEEVINNSGQTDALSNFSVSNVFAAVLSGGAIAGVALGAVGGAGYIFFMLLTVLIGAVISVVTGLITIAARQAVVALLVMISPLALVCYLLPNTEKWFGKWKDLLFKMLIFYPMFSFLFGASQLIGYTLVLSAIAANSGFGIILGIAVMVFPLFFSWPLMRMSGTILGNLNSGLRHLAAPLQRSAAGWSLSMADQRRQRHIANSAVPGAKLRRYLDYRRELRMLDTHNSIDVRRGKALERTMQTASGVVGRDEEGNTVWEGRANRYAMNAKRASLYNTRTRTAQAAYQNTLTGFGHHFNNAGAQSLSAAHGEAYLDAQVQQYLTANEAEADQTWLLDQYLAAQTAANPSASAVAAGTQPNNYMYNRLVKSAAGALGHKGEASIMGQVIAGNSAIENRRRTEARIMINKFGVNKPEFRGMNFDKDHINDNGIATDARGREIEDDQYNLLPGEHYTPWQKYIGVHKTSGVEITKEQYDGLSDSERSNYNKVRYMEIKDDSGNTVQRVYEDDAGYMKEMLRDDIAIGDPINDRYLTEIGVAHTDREQTGRLRKYHSTISAAINETKYKEHHGAFTPMVTAQVNNGYVTNKGQLNIATLQSLNVATKPGPLLQNDAVFIKNYTRMLNSIHDDEQFARYFPDDAILDYRNVNGQSLKGYKKVTVDGVDSWQEVGYLDMESMSEAEILDARKNYIKHNILTKSAKKLIGIANRRIAPNTLDNQKPDTLKAFVELAETLQRLGLENMSDDIPFERKLDGTLNRDGSKNNLFDAEDPSVLQNIIQEAKRTIARIESGEAGTGSPNGSGNNGQQNRPHTQNNNNNTANDILRTLIDQLNRAIENDERNTYSHDTSYMTETVESIIGDNFTDLGAAINMVEEFILNNLDPNDARYNDINEILNHYRNDTPPGNTAESIQRKDDLAREIAEYLRNYGYDD